MKIAELFNQPAEETNDDNQETDWAAWDRQIEADLKDGKLQPVIEEALAQEGDPL